MGSIDALLAELDELAVARNVGVPHDEARMDYALRKNTVDTYEEFTDIIAHYTDHHLSRCVLHGGHLSRTEAAGRAKEILEREYRRAGGNIITAYNDAHDGTNGGLRVVLDKLAEQLKTESVERYTRDVFDRHVAPNAWEEKVSMIGQFLGRYGSHLSSAVRMNQPERYAANYEDLIRAYTEALRRTSSVFRRF